MRKRIILYTITVLFNLIGVLAVAQGDSSSKSLPKYTFGIQPFYLLNHGMRFDIERRIGESANWIQVGPTVYTISRSDNYTYEMMGTDGNSISSLAGGGLNIGYKSFLSDKFFYWQAGVSYTYYSVKYQSFDWVPTVEDQLNYYEYGSSENRQSFNKIGSCVVLGAQTSMSYPVFGDFYLGVGYNYSFYNADKAHFDSVYGFGHRGLLFVAGLRIGFAFGKTKRLQD